MLKQTVVSSRMCLNFGTLEIMNFPFETSGKLIILGVPRPKHIRPEFFYFLVLGKFLVKPSVGGGNKNKNKIQKFPESE